MKAHCTFNQKKAIVGAFGHSLFKLRDCSFAALLGRCKSVLGRVCVNTRSAERLSSWRWLRRWRCWALAGPGLRVISQLGMSFKWKHRVNLSSDTGVSGGRLIVECVGWHFFYFAHIQKTSMLSTLCMPHVSQDSQECLKQSRHCSRVKVEHNFLVFRDLYSGRLTKKPRCYYLDYSGVNMY